MTDDTLTTSAKLNQTRRKRYREDAAYRTAIQSRSRTEYRRNVDKELTSCLRSLDWYETMLRTESVILTSGKTMVLPVMSLPTTAEVLQKRYQTIWRWVNKGMIPKPILQLESGNGSVYHSAEVKILITEIGQLEHTFAYYRKNHTAVRDSIFAKFTTIRKQLKIGV